MKVLCLFDTPISTAARESLCCALKLGGDVTVGLIGAGTDTAAAEIGSCGATRFLAVEGDEFSVSRYSTDAAAAQALIRAASPDLVIAPCTHRWQRTLPGVAQRVAGVVDTHAVDITPTVVRRWYYRQRIEVSLSRSSTPWILLREPGVGEPWTGDVKTVPVEKLPVPANSRTRVEGIEAQAGDQQTIRPEAALLFVAGAGWTKKQKDGQTHTPEAAGLILDFVHQAQASLGSSKSLVDLSGEGQAILPFLTHLHQVGQTGSTPRHRKGLATCCHGEEPHAVGWRFINERRAVNLDANCGWARGKADVLYVADAFEVMREVNRILSSK